MKNPYLLLLPIILICSLWAAPADKAPDSELLALERQVLDGWMKGDPGPALAVFDPDVSYFHVMSNGRLDGIGAVKELYERYRGTSLFDSYEIENPRAQASGDLAVLTYVLVTHQGVSVKRWNATQVYEHQKQGWRIIHSHWSQVGAQQ